MSIIDISRLLSAEIAVWPGDTPFQLTQNLDRRQGDTVNLTTLTLSAHTGTHADAPLHFTDDGVTMDAVELLPYWGLAQVVTVARVGGLSSADFAPYDLSLAPRLLVRSPASRVPDTVFATDFPYPTPELADFLGVQGIILYGSDAPSMDAVNSKTMPGHNGLLRNGIAILEGLQLGHVEDGVYELVALPLKVAGGDGSPVRAALRRVRTGN